MSVVWPDMTLLSKLLTALREQSEGLAWSGTAYRFASMEFAAVSRFIDGEGARRHGGRFTPMDGPRTLYLSMDRRTATAELDSWYDYYGVPDTAFKPRVLAAVGVELSSLLDLSDPIVLNVLQLTINHIVDEWRAVSDHGGVADIQQFGQLVYEAGYEGIRFPSVRVDDRVNVALFPGNFKENSSTTMLNAE